MSSPVANEYLAKALIDGASGKVLVAKNSFSDVLLKHRAVGDLLLPSGKLVASDPLVCPEADSFELGLPKGAFPVVLSVAILKTDQRVAFATIRFRPTAPVAWDMMTCDGQDASKLEPDHFFGYGVDSGTGCFMDAKAGKELQRLMDKNPDFYEVLVAEMEKTYVHTWSWINYKLGNGDQNLLAFSSGFGDGAYATYAGFDSESEVCVVVTDFGVIERN